MARIVGGSGRDLPGLEQPGHLVPTRPDHRSPGPVVHTLAGPCHADHGRPMTVERQPFDRVSGIGLGCCDPPGLLSGLLSTRAFLSEFLIAALANSNSQAGGPPWTRTRYLALSVDSWQIALTPGALAHRVARPF